MGKFLSCKDTGTECDHVIRGTTEEEIMRKAAEHAVKDHGLTEIPPDMESQIRTLIREE